MSDSLYQITGRMLELKVMLDEIDDETDETMVAAINDTLEGVDLEFRDKAINVQMYIENLVAQALAIKNAIKRMTLRLKRIERRIDTLTQYLIKSMQVLDITSISCDHFEMKLAKNPQKLEISNPELIPAMYKEKQITAAYIPASMTPEELIKLEKASELFSSIGIEINTSTSILNAEIKADLKKDILVEGAELTRGTRLAVR